MGGLALPLFLVPGTYQAELGLFTLPALLQLASCWPVTVIMAYVYERLDGRVVAAIAVHLAYNATGSLLRVDSVLPLACSTVVLIVLAAMLYRTAQPRGSAAMPSVAGLRA